MNILEAAKHFQVERKTILKICHDPELSIKWGCKKVNGEWKIETPPKSKYWYTLQEMTSVMRRSRWQIFRWCKSNAVLAIRVGRNYRIPKEEADKLFSIRG